MLSKSTVQGGRCFGSCAFNDWYGVEAGIVGGCRCRGRWLTSPEGFSYKLFFFQGDEFLLASDRLIECELSYRGYRGKWLFIVKSAQVITKDKH